MFKTSRSAPKLELLTCAVHDRRIGILLPDVVEVVRAVAVTPLPGAPRIVDGAIDFRGRIVPVLNTRVRLGTPHQEVDPGDRFVVVRAGDRVLALRVDRVDGIEAAEPPEPGAADERFLEVEHLAGVVRLPGGLAVVADLPRFLSEAEGRVLDRALEEVGVRAEEAP